LEKTSFSTADAITIFGQRAGPGFLSLVNQGSEALRVLTQKNKEAGQEVDVTSKALGFNKKQHDELRWAFLSSFDAVSDFKFNMDDTTAVLGAFIKRGASTVEAQDKLQKAMQATSNDAILPLIGATRKLDGTLLDADGEVLNFQSVLRLLEGTGLTSAEALDIFGESGLALVEAMNLPAEEISKLSEKMANSGTAAEIAVKQMEGVKGGLKRFQSSLEGIAIVALGGKDGIINKMADAADAVALFFNGLMTDSPGVLKAIVGIIFALGGLGIAFRIFGSLARGVAGLVKMFSWLAANPAFIGFVLLTVALIGAYKSSEAFREALKYLFDQISAVYKLIKDLLKPIKGLGDEGEKTGKKTSVMSDIFKAFGDAFAVVATTIGNGIKKFREWVDNLSPEELDKFKNTLQTVIEGLKLAAIVIGVSIAVWGLLALAIWGVSTALTVLTSPILLIVAAVIGLGFAFKMAYDKIAPFRDFVDGFVDKLQEFAQAFINGKPAIEEGVGPLERFGHAVRAVYDLMVGIVIQPIIDGFKALLALFSGDFQGASDIAKNAISSFGDSLKALPGAISEILTQSWDFTSEMADKARGILAQLMTAITGAIGEIPILGPLSEALGGTLDSLLLIIGGWSDILSGVFTWDTDKIKMGFLKLKDSMLVTLGEVIPDIAKGILDLVLVALDLLGSVSGKIADWLKGEVHDGIDKAIEAIKNIPILGGFGGAILETIQGGLDIVGGLAKILEGIFTLDKNKIGEGLGSIVVAIGDFFVDLPLQLLSYIADAGDALGSILEGAANWVVDNAPKLFDKLKNLPEIIGNFFKNLFGGGDGGGKGGGGGGKEKDNPFVSFISGNLEKLGEWLQTDAGPKVIAALTDFFGRLPGILFKIVKSVFRIAVTLLVGTYSVLVDWLMDLWGLLANGIKNLGGILFNAVKEAVMFLFKAIPTVLNYVIDVFKNIPGMIIGALAALGNFLFPWIKDAFEVLVEYMPTVLALVLNFFAGIPAKLVQLLSALGGYLVAAFQFAFALVVEYGPGILLGIINFFVSLPGKIIGVLASLGGLLLGWLTTAFNWLVENGPVILATLWGWISGIPAMLLGLLGNLGGMLLGWLTAAFNWLVENGPGILATLLGWVLTIPRMLVDGLLILGGLLFDGVKLAFNFIVERGPEVLATVLGWVTGIPGMLIGGLGAIGEQLFTWAKAGFDLVKEKGPELLTGLVEFFKGIPGKLVDALGGAATGAFNFAAKIFNALRGFINDKLIKKLQNISVFGAKPFEGIPTIPDIPLAEGGIITKATNALIGEDGAEVVIPLTKPERAKQLLVQSGLMDIIASGSPGIAMSPAPSTPDAGGITSTVTSAMSSVVDSAVAALQPVKDWFASLSMFAIDSLKTFGETVWAGVQVTFQFLAAQILMLLESLTAYIALWPITVSGLLANTGNLIWLSMVGGMGAFANSFKAVFNDLSLYVTTWKTGLETGFGGLPAYMGGIASGITGAVAAPFRAFAAGVWNPFASTLTGALDQIPATANINIPSLTFPTAHSGGVIGGRLPETGGPFESSEMLVKMQRGEGVIPASVMNAMTPAEFETIRRGDFGERDPRADKAMTQRFLPQMGAPAAPMPPLGGDSFATLPSSILEGLKDALKVTIAEAKSLSEQAFYAPKYLGGIVSSAAMGGLGFVGQKIEEANKATADAMGGVGTAFPGGAPIGLPAAIDRLRQVAGRPGNYRALIDYMTATQVPFRAVSMVRAGATTRGSGGARASLHASGRAVDFAGLRASRDSPELLRIYRAFEPVRGILQELIYSGPGGGFVRNPITRADHHDHVHAGLANGAIVSRRMTAMLGEAGPEVVIPLTRPMRALQLAEESGLMGVLSQAAGQRAATQSDTTSVPLGGEAAGSVAVQGLFPGQGNTYNIYGISMAQVIAEIEAREQASTRVNFTRR
jgi:hypothetical protein